MTSLKIYYDNGEIRISSSGVDVSNFSFVDIVHPDPARCRMKDIQMWLTHYFQLDPNIYSVNVQCLWTRTFDPLCWELKEVSQTEKWLSWLNWCRRRHAEYIMLVQPCPKEM